jgi:hypothetical protein
MIILCSNGILSSILSKVEESLRRNIVSERHKSSELYLFIVFIIVFFLKKFLLFYNLHSTNLRYFLLEIVQAWNVNRREKKKIIL